MGFRFGEFHGCLANWRSTAAWNPWIQTADGKPIHQKHPKHMVQVAYMILMFWDTNVLPRKSDLNLSMFHSGQVIIFLQTANTFTKAWILLSSWSHTLMNTVAATLAPKLCTIGTLSSYWRWLISRFVALDIINLFKHHLVYHHVCYANLSGPLTREAQFLRVAFEKHSKRALACTIWMFPKIMVPPNHPF